MTILPEQTDMQPEDRKGKSRLIPLKGVLLGSLLTVPLWIVILVVVARFLR